MKKVKLLERIKAVGFDVDGTLYHAPTAMHLAVADTLIRKAAAELARDPDDLAQEYLKRREELRSNTMTLSSFGLDGEKIFQAVWDEIAVEKYMSHDKKLVKLIKDLKKKYQIFIITNGSGKQVERKLNHLGLDYHDFDPRIYCYDQGWVKPEPAPFLAAIESLEMKPEEIVYIGDREDLDIEAAQMVGMKAIFVGGESEIAEESCETVYDIGQYL